MPIVDQASHFSGEQTGRRLDALLKDRPTSVSPMMGDADKTYKQIKDELYRRSPKYGANIRSIPRSKV